MKISLIIIFIGLCTVAPAIYFGVTLFDGKVTDKPYETGLEYNKINKVIAANDIAIKDIKTEKKNGKIALSFNLSHKSDAKMDKPEFYVSRPATDQDNETLTAVKQPDGSYKGEFKADGYGNFVLEARAKVSNEEISIQKNFYINQ